MYRLAIMAVILCVVTATAGCLTNEDASQPTAATMTMQTYLDQYRQAQDTANKTAYIWLTSLDEGDTVHINDTIDIITCNTSMQQNRTLIKLRSVNSSDPQRGGLAFQGDITQQYHAGDNVTVTVHIANVTFTSNNTATGDRWTVHYELFREQWDNATETDVPLPARCISHRP
jgi:hypothetical protein